MAARRLIHDLRTATGFGAACLLHAVALAGSPPIRVVTEELPPYNMTIAGKLTGVSTEIVEAVLKQAGLAAQFQSMPWARAYELAKAAKADENVLIYSITWSEERRSLFKWVGVIAPSETWLYSAADRPLVLTRIDDAKFYRIATVNQDVGEHYLLARGFMLGRNLQSSTRYELALEMMRLRRADLWLATDLTARWFMRRSGRRQSDVLFRSLRLPALDDDGVYMAFGAHTPDALVERCRQALATIHRNGTFDAIQKKWH